MSEERYDRAGWSKELRTYMVDASRWKHTFTVLDRNGKSMDVDMGSPDSGDFTWSHEADGFNLSGGVWYGDDDRLPGEVCFTIEWRVVDDEKVKELESDFEQKRLEHDHILTLKEDFDADDKSTWPKDEHGRLIHEFDDDEIESAEDAEDWFSTRADTLESELESIDDELEQEREGNWEQDDVTVEMWGSINDPQTDCRDEVPGFDDWPAVFAVAAGLREMCHKIYSEGREHKGEVIA